MKVIPPITITGALLTSSTAAEPAAGETAWVSGTTYAVGDRRIRTTTHRIYERLTAGAGTTAPESDAINWLDVGPTNKWAMFDLYRNTATSQASPLTVVITPGKRVDAIALMGVQADSVTISVSVSAVVVYTVTAGMTLHNSVSWSGYFYGSFGYQPSFVRFDLPLFANAVITVTLTRASGNAVCGALCLGRAVDLGTVLSQARSDGLNFSTITRDAFGNATLVPRRTVPKTDQTLMVPKAQVDSLRDVRTALNAVPAVWSGLDDQDIDGYFEALLILGIYKEFSLSLNNQTYATLTLQLEEI